MNFEIENGILKKYKGTTPDVIIPSCVTEIGERAFYNNNYLRSVIITGNIQTIGDSAFSYCYNLEKIVIPKSVKKIGNNVFYDTKWLKDKKANAKNVVIINGIAISRTNNISVSVNLSGVKEIRPEIFQNCYQIKEFIISDGVKIGKNAFHTGSNFNICLKSNTMSINIPVKATNYYSNSYSRYAVFSHDSTQSLFDFISADTKNKEILFDELEIPEYRYPLAVFMANTYQSKFFKTFINVHRDKIREYAKNNAPDLLKFIR